MGKQQYFYALNSEAGNALNAFFHSEDLSSLFAFLYDEVKSILPSALIRGIPGEIFGVSLSGEHCVFYVSSRRDGSFGIRFRGLSGEMNFTPANTEEVSRLVLNGAQRRERFPEDYRITGNRVPDAPAADRPKRKAAPAAEAPKKSPRSGKKAPKASNPAPQPAADPRRDHSAEIRYVDKELVCQDCGDPFIFTAGEQRFYAKKGLVEPKRCKPCRKKKKQLEADGKYVGLSAITGKMGTKSSGYLDHAGTYGASINVNGGLEASPGYRRGKEKNGKVEFRKKVGKKTYTITKGIDH